MSSNGGEAKRPLEAYRVGTVLSHLKKFKVTSLETWQDKLIVGCSDGSLRLSECIDETNIIFRETQFVHEFAKKPVEQLQVVTFQGQTLLVSLSDQYIYVHSLPEFKFLCKLEKSNGAYKFALNRGAHQDTKTDLEMSPFLCLSVAVKRRIVLVYNWNPAEQCFKWKKDLAVPDTVYSMDWAGRYICLGFARKEYNLIHFLTGKNRPIFNTGKKGVPVSAILPNREILLAKDTWGVCVDYDAKPTGPRQEAFIWSELPVQFAYHHPYIIGVLQTMIEVRNMNTRACVQRIRMKDPTMITRQGALFVANSNSLKAFIPIPLQQQIEALIASKQFKNALSLIDQTHDSDWSTEEEKKQKINDVHTIHAYELFNKGDYQSSMLYFQKTACDPRKVLALFPEVLPKRQLLTFKHPVPVTRIVGEDNLLRALSALIPFLEMTRSRLSLASQMQPQSSHHSLEAYQEQPPHHHQQQQQQQQQQSSAAVTDTSSSSSSSEMELSVLIDTTLLKSYLFANDALVMPFLEQGSKCDITQSRGLLQFHDKFKELICLFQSRNMHLQALQLLSQCGQTPAPGQLTGTEPSVIYLQNLVEQCTERPEYVKLVLDFSKWILLKEPEEGLRIFTHCHENGNVALGIPPFTVLDHLKKTSDREVCIAYLESLVYTGETNPYFHNELIFLYLDGVSNLLPKKPTTPTEQPQAPHTTEAKTTVVAPVEAKQKKKRVTAGMEAGRLGILRRKLIEFLKSSVHYNPEKMLSWFPRDELLEERAILLSRINQHLQALTIYAHKLHDPEIAEQYCAEYYNAQSEEEKQMYLHLFRVYLQPPEDLHPRAEPLVKPALTLLAKHYDRIDSNEALRLLPNDTNIRDLMPFFKNVLTSVKHKRRTNQIKKNLLMAEHRRVRLQSLDTARPRILLDKHTACMKCKKKIGAHSAFARLPTGEVIHYICYSVKNQ